MADRRVLLLSGLAAALLLTSCASVPTSGRVNTAGAVTSVDPPPYVDFDPAPPRRGADEREVVRDYIRAMSEYVPGFAVARGYLTEEAARIWTPDTGITVFAETLPEIEVVDDGEVEMTLTVEATVDTYGSYQRALADGAAEVTVSLEQVQGEWRIEDPPPGLLMSSVAFRRVYRAYDRYFFSPTYDRMVPDRVHLPVQGSVSTLLTRALLAGPPSRLAPAVQTAFDPTDELSVSSVPIEDGTAVLELAGSVESADAQTRSRMLAQLIWTLTGVPEISAVDAQVAGLPLVESAPGGAGLGEFPGLAPDADIEPGPLVAVSDDGVVLPAGQTGPAPGPVGAQPGLTDVAVSRDGTRVAVVEGGSRLSVIDLAAGAESVLLHEGERLSSPTFDGSGALWVVDASRSVLVVQPDGDVSALRLGPAGDSQQVDAVAVAPDGTRVAAIVDDAVVIGAIARDLEGDILAVPQLEPLNPSGTTGVDVTWAGPADVVAILEDAEGVRAPTELSLDGATSVRRREVEGAVTVTGGSRVPTVVGSDDGKLFRLDSAQTWTGFGRGRTPAYPG